MNWTQLSKEVYEQNVQLGHWDIERSPAMIRLLIQSELFEAFEAWREDRFVLRNDKDALATIQSVNDFDDDTFKRWFSLAIKKTVQEECADLVIRLLDLAGRNDICLHYVTGSQHPVFDDNIRAFEYTLYMLGDINGKLAVDLCFSHVLKFCEYLCNEDIAPYVLWKKRYNLIVGRDPNKKI